MPNNTRLGTMDMPVACFAPPLTDEILTKYEEMADALPDSMGQIRDIMRECLTAIKQWWELPESKGSQKDVFLELRHRGKDTTVKLTSLTPDLIEQLWEAVPWDYELDAMQRCVEKTFEDRSAHPKELIDACYHLLWHARELCLDREPLTQDKLGE